MIENIEILMSYNNLSINEIFYALSSDKTYNLLTFIPEINKNFKILNNNYILNETNVSSINNTPYLNSGDKEALVSFFSTLGKSDLNGQIKNCRIYKDIFKKKLKENEDKEQNDCKSSGMMILGLGFLIIIMVI